MELFDNSQNHRNSIGKSKVEYIQSSSILTPGKGFMNSYDYTLNPYSGCAFGCNYCYAAFFARSEDEKENWGYWVKVKENALALLIKQRKKPLYEKTIYLSSVTDPYQPIEKDLEITRSILKELINYHKVRLVVQTRSSLVTRDIDLFKKFEIVQVNMTITTDSEEIRKAFEPLCPSNKIRLAAIKQIQEADINSCITMTPLLPIQNPEEFIFSLLATGVKKYIVQPFHPDKGKFIACTRADAISLTKKYNWDQQRYENVLNILKEKLPFVGEGKEGFSPI